MTDLKVVEVNLPGTKSATALIRNPNGRETVATVNVGSFVRIADDCKSYDGTVIAIFKDGFVLGWLDKHNHRQYDGFGWNAEILVF